MDKIKKINGLYSEADNLLKGDKKTSSPEFKSWKNDCIIFLTKMYGAESIELNQFKQISFSNVMAFSSNENPEKFKNGIDTAKLFLKKLMEYEDEDFDAHDTQKFPKDKIFIVHGHDELLKTRVARLVEQQDIDAIILHENINSKKIC